MAPLTPIERAQYLEKHAKDLLSYDDLLLLKEREEGGMQCDK